MIEITKEMVRLFPPTPAHSGEMITVYFEPMIGSGERITVLIAAVLADGSPLVEYTLSQEKLADLFGSQASKVLDMLQMAGFSLLRCLQAGHGLMDWHPPLEGFYPTEPSPVSYDDPGEIIRQAKMFRCAFSCLDCRHPVNKPSIACGLHRRSA